MAMEAAEAEPAAAAAHLMLMQSLISEVIQKVRASLAEKIGAHVATIANSTGATTDSERSNDFDPSSALSNHGLDFLDTKNSLLLSYLIDLTVHLRGNIISGSSNMQRGNSGETETAKNNNGSSSCLRRLTEMRTVLDKMRGLDKKLRYQIDKLLAAHESFAVTTTAAAEEDPLQFRPGVAGTAVANGGETRESGAGGDGEDEGAASDADGNDDDDDDDLAAARKTLATAKQKKNDDDDGNNNDGVYRAPRMTAVPYQPYGRSRSDDGGGDRGAAGGPEPEPENGGEREKRRLKRLRASEVAQALRGAYGDAPETEDTSSGGAELGRQREAARRLAERQAERTAFEEDNMIRLTVPRAERKERQRLMRQETSNLTAISDLGSLVVRDSSTSLRNGRATGGGGGRQQRSSIHHDNDEMGDARHASGKRRRQAIDHDGRAQQHDGGRSNKTMMKSQNPLQAALYGGGGEGAGKKSKKKKNPKR